jgi:predicted ATPase
MAKLTKAEWKAQQEDAIKMDAWQVGLLRKQVEDLTSKATTDNSKELSDKLAKYTESLAKAENRHAKFKAEIESWWK